MNGRTEITADNSKRGGGTVGVYIKEGEKMVIKSYLEEGKIEIMIENQDQQEEIPENATDKEVVGILIGKNIVKTVKGYNTYELEVPEGRYKGIANVLGKTTGRVTITAEKK